ncbi:hypothetical protein ACFQ40_07510 [Kroppenstedtia eburnea]|uniref:hypothetical protein n=1 Tax=Kroppenstedtia eburnea TaxID=714067 RepID=UPI00363C7156
MDMLLYDQEGGLIKVLEIPVELHRSLFRETEVWRSYLELRKIRDYYKANVNLGPDEIKRFQDDLEQISLFLSPCGKELARQLISEIKVNQPWKVRITGDQVLSSIVMGYFGWVRPRQQQALIRTKKAREETQAE